jgi:YaiO family outer membrane protein
LSISLKVSKQAMFRIAALFIFLLFSVPVWAQTDYTAMGVDDLFKLARENAFNGEREEARKICTVILTKSPGYKDVKILMGRTYAWDGNRIEAKRLFREVLAEDDTYLDAYIALIDVEMWDDKPDVALAEADKALAYHPNNIELLLKKVKVLLSLKREEDALFTLSKIEAIDPACKPCKEIRRSLKAGKFKHTVSASFAMDFYDKVFDPMYYSAIQFGTKTKAGTVIGRINYSHRFGDNGVQPEIDYYPGLWKGAYGYLNYGYTSSSLFARHRFGAEVYQSLPISLEASIGLRYLYFGGSSDVTIYTASLGWYYKNYWFSLRPYITPGNGSFSRSLNFTTRRYFSDANNYVGFTTGAGFSPDQRRIQSNTGLENNNIYFLKSQKFEFNFQKSIRYNLTWSLDLSYSHQELAFSYGDFVNVMGFTTGIRMRF